MLSKKMRSLISFAFIFLMLFSLVGCSSQCHCQCTCACMNTTTTTTTTNGLGGDITLPDDPIDDPSDDKESLKLGLGVVVSADASNATADRNGEGEADVTVAAVLVDKDGKIVKVVIDVMQLTLEYTINGEAFANTEFKSKQEWGDDYGMKNPIYGSAKEWYEHAAIFCNAVVGKTVADIAGVGSSSELATAGCTIYVGDFVKAVEKAVNNAKASNATAESALKIGMSVEQSTADATAYINGSNKADTTIVAVAMNGEIVVSAFSDCVSVSFGFDKNGTSIFDATAEIKTKHELGDDYGMKNPSWGSAKEWYEHANAFDAACAGKTVAQIAGLVGDADLIAAGCTIRIDGFIAAVGNLQD